jgi:hypothetical protein
LSKSNRIVTPPPITQDRTASNTFTLAYPIELSNRPQTILAFLSTTGVSCPREQEFNQQQNGLEPMEVFFLIIVAAVIAIFLAMLRSSPADRLRSRGMMGGYFIGGDSDMSGPVYTPPMDDGTDPNWPHHHHQPGGVPPSTPDGTTDQSGGYQGGTDDTSSSGGSYDSGSSSSGGFDSGSSGGGSDSGGSDSGGSSSSGSDSSSSSSSGGGDCG